MSTCSGKQDLRGEEYHWDGALARLVRRALHESVGKEEPSPRVWREIAEGISSQSQTRGRRVSGGLRPLRSAALAQVVVIVALLLALFVPVAAADVRKPAKKPVPSPEAPAPPKRS